jgi:probable rRNA maturation factor
MRVAIDFESEVDLDQTIAHLIQRAAADIADSECPDILGLEVSLSFVSETEIRSLNRDYRGVDAVTDVLSFPQFDSRDALAEAIRQSLSSGMHETPALIGDIMICRPRALHQAAEYGHSALREIVYLFVHGLLHLLGYDHLTETEKETMRSKEEASMARLGLAR